MGNYRITNDAKSDLIRIHQYGVRKFGEQQADKYYFALFEQFEVIAKNPKLFPSVDHIKKGYRRSISGVDSIYYRIDNKTVEIIAVIGKQDIGSKLF